MRKICAWSVAMAIVGGLYAQPLLATAMDAPLSPSTFISSAAQLDGTLRLRGIKTAEGGSAEFELTRFQVFTHDARIVVERGDGQREEAAAPATAFFRGQIAGEAGSRVFVSVETTGNVSGLIERGGKMLQLVDLGAGAERLVMQVIPDSPHKAHGEGFTCGSDKLASPPATAFPISDLKSLPVPPPPTGDTADKSTASANYRARIAIETDFEFYSRFNSTSTATTYVGNLIGFASTIYTAQVQTQLEVSYLRLWSTASDPWVQTTSNCGMFEFGKYWNDNMSGTSRTIAHMLSGKSTGGGVAWLGVLCSTGFNTSTSSSNCPGMAANGNFGGGYGFTGNITGSFNAANPTPVWDIVATSHEIGHNFDSPHTHCYNNVGGNASPVDQCYNGEASNSCYSGAQALPGAQGTGSGTIMSYCHLLSGGMSNISLTLGAGHAFGVQPSRVPTRMAAHVASKASQNPSCLALGAPVTPTIFATRFE